MFRDALDRMNLKNSKDSSFSRLRENLKPELGVGIVLHSRDSDPERCYGTTKGMEPLPTYTLYVPLGTVRDQFPKVAPAELAVVAL
jgi:hypothetical protein